MPVKIHHQKTLLLSIAAFLIFLFGVAFPVLAQTPADDASLRLVTSPLPINLITEPGATISAELRVKNGGTKTEKLQVGLLKFAVFGEEGKPKLMEQEKGDEFFDWVTFSEDTFEVLPNEWKTITATFYIPDYAAFGYYYAITFSRAAQVAATGPRQTAIVGATATLVLLEVRVPHAKREIEVIEFNADKKIYEFLPVTFTVELRNRGNVHAAPRGNIFIDKGEKHEIAILEVNPGQGNVLPDSVRIFQTQWTDGFPIYVDKIEDSKVVLDEKGNPVKKLEWDFSQANKLRWGKYTANMLLVYDDGKRDIPIEGTVSFWVIPWRIILGAIVVAVFVFIGLYATLRNFWRKVFRKRR